MIRRDKIILSRQREQISVGRAAGLAIATFILGDILGYGAGLYNSLSESNQRTREHLERETDNYREAMQNAVHLSDKQIVYQKNGERK